jgi:hypothetical protein
MTTGVVLDPTAVFDDGALYCVLGISAASLARARRDGHLRYTRQGRRILYLGEWVTNWLRQSALRPQEALA